MKKIMSIVVLAVMLAGPASARELQYPPQTTNAPVSDNNSGYSSNLVPIVAIVGAVVTTGLILFKIHRVKQARAARFNVYAMAKGTH